MAHDSSAHTLVGVEMRWLVTIPMLATILVGVEDLRAQGPELYQVDVTHGLLEFRVRLAGFNRVRGSFDAYRGHLLVVPNDTLQSGVAFLIDVRTIHTADEQRDEHLKGPDFFDSAKWPTMQFLSTRIERDGRDYAAIGNLTIRDVTREVRAPFKIVAEKGTDPFGNERFSVAGKLTINRRDFGVVGPPFWNRAISDSVEIEFETPGRRWNYDAMALVGTAERPSVGKLILDGIAAKGLDAALADGWKHFQENRGDSTRNFGWFEYLKAAGRLAQAGKSRESAAVLELGARVSEANGRPAGAANLRAALAEAHLRAGDRARAGNEAAAALKLDSRNTAALLLAEYLGRQTTR